MLEDPDTNGVDPLVPIVQKKKKIRTSPERYRIPPLFSGAARLKAGLGTSGREARIWLAVFILAMYWRSAYA